MRRDGFNSPAWRNRLTSESGLHRNCVGPRCMERNEFHEMKSDDQCLQRLMDLLDSGSMEVVVETLRLLQVISKRSRFISQHLSESQQKQLTMKLTAIVQVLTSHKLISLFIYLISEMKRKSFLYDGRILAF